MHADSVVMPFMLPDTPIVAWWPDTAPRYRLKTRWGSWRFAALRTRRTARTHCLRSKPVVGLHPGDTDLAWSRITHWRALLTATVDQPPYEPITSALVSGLKTEPALDILAGWLASRIDGPVRRAVGELKVELVRCTETVTLSRPQDGVTATLSRTGRPDALVPLPRRETRECLAEDLRRLDPDDIYFAALGGINKVQYI